MFKDIRIKVMLALLLLCNITEVKCYNNSIFAGYNIPFAQTPLKDKFSYSQYVTFVTAGVLGSLYVCYTCLTSSYKLKKFIWKGSIFSSVDHRFAHLNAWSLYSLSKLTLASMKSCIDTLCSDLSVTHAGLNEAQDYHDELARIDVLKRFNLYQFSFFRKTIRKFPEYKAHILATIRRAEMNPSFKEKLNTAQGFEPGGLLLFLTEEEKWIKEAC